MKSWREKGGESCVQLVTLLKVEDAMFPFTKTPEVITNLLITIYALLSNFWNILDLRAFLPRPGPPRGFSLSPRPTDFYPAPPCPAEKCFAPHIPGRLPKGALHLTRRCPFNPIYPSTYSTTVLRPSEVAFFISIRFWRPWEEKLVN